MYLYLLTFFPITIRFDDTSLILKDYSTVILSDPFNLRETYLSLNPR